MREPDAIEAHIRETFDGLGKSIADGVMMNIRAARQRTEREIVAWLRADNSRCDCAALEEGECACGGWDDYKTLPLLDIANAIERGEYRPPA